MKKQMRMLALLVAALAPATLASQTRMMTDTMARPISLDEAVRMAQRNAPQAVQARNQAYTARAQVRSAWGAYIPNVSLSMGSTWQGGQQARVDQAGNVISGDNPWNYTSGLGANVQLFDGGRRWYDVGRTRAVADAADANEILSAYNVSLSVHREYFNVLAARDRQENARLQLEQAEQQLRAASARVAAGAATKSDSLRSVILVGNARLAMLTAANELQNANAALTRLVATPFLVTAEQEETLAPVRVPLDSVLLLEYAETAPIVEGAEAELLAARARVRATRTAYLPTLNMQFNRSGTGLDNRFGLGNDPFRYSSRVQFGLSYNLFDGFNREMQIANARAAEDNANALLRDARLRAQQEVVQFSGLLQTATARIEIAEISVAAAEEDLRVQQQRYNLGASTLLDVLTSQTQLNNARNDLIRARYDYRIAKAQLEALLGRDL